MVAFALECEDLRDEFGAFLDEIVALQNNGPPDGIFVMVGVSQGQLGRANGVACGRIFDQSADATAKHGQLWRARHDPA